MCRGNPEDRDPLGSDPEGEPEGRFGEGILDDEPEIDDDLLEGDADDPPISEIHDGVQPDDFD